MKTTDMRAKARAIFGSAVAEPMPKQPNGAKALQQRANARPIPTYKVGGVVKKPMPTPAASAASGNRMSKQEGDEMRFMDMMEKKKKSSMPSPAASAASGNRVAKQEGDEMRKMKMAQGGKMPDLTGDGKVTRADVLKGRGVKGFAKGGMEKGGKVGKYGVGGLAFGQATQQIGSRLLQQIKAGTMTNAQAQAAYNAYVKNQLRERTQSLPRRGPTGEPEQPARELPTQTGAQQVAAAYRDTGARLNEQVKAGQITPQQATAMARPAFMATTKNSPIVQSTMAQAAVPPLQRAKGGKVQTSSDTARKLATEMGGYKKGGKAGKYADGGMAEEMLVEGRRPQNVAFDINRMQGTTGGRMGPPAPSSGGSGRGPSVAVPLEAPPATRGRMPIARTAGYLGPTFDVGDGRLSAGMGRRGAVGVGYAQPFKKGGKVKQVDVDMKMLEEMSRPKMSLPNLESKAAEARNLNAVRAKETSDAAKKQSFKEAFNEARRDQGPNGVFTWRGNTYNTKMAGETSKAAPARAPAPAPTRAAAPAAAPAPATRGNAPAAAAPTRGNPPAAPANKSGNASSSMSSVIRNLDSGYDLDAEAKKIMAKRNDSFFRSPISMKEAREEARAEAENVRKMSGYRAEQERKKRSLEAGRKANPDLVSQFVDMTMNPGYKKGGKVKETKPKNGLAVMIAIGKPMKPTKKMNGGPMASGSKDMEASKVTRDMAMGGDPMGYAAGGAGKMRKGMMPEKFAQGGAGKVRKGMMTPEGNIIKAMNKMRGK